MKKVMLDTNIYGQIVADVERERILNGIVNSKNVLVYGTTVVRNELRDTPRFAKLLGRNLRITLLNIFDSVVGNRSFGISKKCVGIAEAYFKTYKEFSGIKSKKEMINDFLIVSVASLNNLDVVVSSDQRSMMSMSAVKAYNLVNKIFEIKNPQFLIYEKFKRWFV